MDRRIPGMKSFVVCLILLILVLSPLAAVEGTAVGFYQQGKEALVQEKYYEAVEYFSSALQENPQYKEALQGLGEAYFYLEEYTISLDYIERARRLDRNSIPLMNFEGRVRIGLGEYEKARTLYNEVASREPNNLNAQFGFVEIDILEGNFSSAVDRLRATLSVHPENRRALLALNLLYDSEDNMEMAEIYLQMALRYHSNDPTVHFFAARHYMEKQRWESAEYHTLTVLSIYPDYPDANRLLGSIYIGQGKFEEAKASLSLALEQDPEDPLGYYLLGMALEGLQDWESALVSYMRGLEQQPDDEFIRLALEQVLIENFDEDAEERITYARYYLDRGRLMEEKNLFRKAYHAYRRAILMAPYDRDIRFAFSDIHRKMGYPARYLEGLQFLIKNGYSDDQEILEAVETYDHVLDDSVSRKWEVDQFNQSPPSRKIVFFLDSNDTDTIHPNAGSAMLRLLRHEAGQYDHIEGTVTHQASSGNKVYSDYFRIARQSQSDYFVVFDLKETERSVSLQANLYLSRTGSSIYEDKILRSGNDRVFSAAQIIMERLQNEIPRTARIIDREMKTLLFDWGRWHGVRRDDAFLILKKGSLQLSKEEPGYRFTESDVLGELRVTETDEEISQGTYEKDGFFDMVNQGDILLPVKKEEDSESEEDKKIPGLLSSEEEKIFAEEVYKWLLKLK